MKGKGIKKGNVLDNYYQKDNFTYFGGKYNIKRDVFLRYKRINFIYTYKVLVEHPIRVLKSPDVTAHPLFTATFLNNKIKRFNVLTLFK